MHRKFEDEVSGEPIGVAPDLLVKPLCGHAVNPGQVRIKDHSLAAHRQNQGLDGQVTVVCGLRTHGSTSLSSTTGLRRRASLAAAREAVDAVLQESDIDDLTRQRTVLCISEAVTNMLLHGGGSGSMTLRRLDDRLRVVVADEGPGMNFLNWIEPPTKKGQASMGYGFKIILDYLDAVGLRTGRTGTTLVLDRKTD